MAHFAQLDDNNIVTQVIVVANNELLLDGVESEVKGILFCKSLFGEDTKWVQTSYNGNFRKNYAGIGYHWDGVGFYAPQPFLSWNKNENTYLWEPPVAYPTDGKSYRWDEPTTSWVEVPEPTE